MFVGHILKPLLGLFLILGFAIETSAADHISVWQVRDADNIVYLAGSVHLLQQSDLPIPAGYYSAYEDSKHVYFELDMAHISHPQGKARLLELGKLPKKQRLSFFISDKTMKRLRRHVKSKGIPPRAIDRLKPGMIILTLSALAAQETGASPDLGVESLIYRRCLQDHKSTSGLETPEFQLSMFDNLSVEILEELINQGIDNKGLADGSIEKLIQAWKTGDSKTLNDLITDDTPNGRTVHDIIITKRNQSWLPVIEKSIGGTQNELFVVGAGHLIGPDGIVQLLRNKGYQITQLQKQLPQG